MDYPFKDGSDSRTLNRAPVNVLVFRLLQSRILVEQIGHIGQIEFRVSSDHVCGRDELSAAEAVGLFQHALGSLQVVFFLSQNKR